VIELEELKKKMWVKIDYSNLSILPNDNVVTVDDFGNMEVGAFSVFENRVVFENGNGGDERLGYDYSPTHYYILPDLKNKNEAK
jgi:hypothetical protein